MANFDTLFSGSPAAPPKGGRTFDSLFGEKGATPPHTLTPEEFTEAGARLPIQPPAAQEGEKGFWANLDTWKAVTEEGIVPRLRKWAHTAPGSVREEAILRALGPVDFDVLRNPGNYTPEEVGRAQQRSAKREANQPLSFKDISKGMWDTLKADPGKLGATFINALAADPFVVAIPLGVGGGVARGMASVAAKAGNVAAGTAAVAGRGLEAAAMGGAYGAASEGSKLLSEQREVTADALAGPAGVAAAMSAPLGMALGTTMWPAGRGTKAPPGEPGAPPGGAPKTPPGGAPDLDALVKMLYAEDPPAAAATKPDALMVQELDSRVRGITVGDKQDVANIFNKAKGAGVVTSLDKTGVEDLFRRARMGLLGEDLPRLGNKAEMWQWAKDQNLSVTDAYASVKKLHGLEKERAAVMAGKPRIKLKSTPEQIGKTIEETPVRAPDEPDRRAAPRMPDEGALRAQLEDLNAQRTAMLDDPARADELTVLGDRAQRVNNQLQELGRNASRAEEVLREFGYGRGRGPDVARSRAPQADSSIKASVKADTGRLIDLLGSSMYMGNLINVAAKELIQNSFDAVKSIKTPGFKGKIEITADRSARTLTVADNGLGMTPKTVTGALFTIGGTEKSALKLEERSGGLGLAKMAFLFGSDHVRVETVKDGRKTIVDADASTLRSGEFDVKTTDAAGAPSGTTVTVTIPKSYTDPRTGEAREIYFPYNADSIEILGKPLLGDVDVLYRQGGEAPKMLGLGRQFDTVSTPKFTTAKFSWGSADIYVGKKRTDSPEHSVLSAGLFQFSPSFKASADSYDRLPYNVIVDVKPQVEPTHPEYPFNNQREGWRGTIQADTNALERYLQTMHQNTETQNTANTFRDAVVLPKVEIDLTAEEYNPAFAERAKRAFIRKPRAGDQPLAEAFVPDEWIKIEKGGITGSQGQELAPASERARTKSSFEADRELAKRADFMTKGFDPSQPILHNNTGIDYVAEARARDPKAQPEAFFSEMGSLVWKFKDEIGKLYSPYWVADLRGDYAVGLSIDKEYRGVHVRVPYKAFFVNPLNLEAGSIGQYGREALTTMLHEAAHTASMEHGDGFMQAYHALESALALEGRHRFYEEAAMAIAARYEPTLNILREIFNESTTRNIAKPINPHGEVAGRNGGLAASDRGSVSEGQVRSNLGNASAAGPDAAARAGGDANAARSATPGSGETNQIIKAKFAGERPQTRDPFRGPGNRQRGAIDRKLLIGLGLAGAGALVGAEILDNEPIRGALLGAAAAGILPWLRPILNRMAAGGDAAAGLLSTQINNLTTKDGTYTGPVLWRARGYEQRVAEKSVAALVGAAPFIKAYGKLDTATKDALTKAADSGNFSEAARIMAATKNTDLIQGWLSIRKTLKGTGETLKAMGRITPLENYFPRSVKDLEGLMGAIGQEHATHLEAAISKAEAASMRAYGQGLSTAERDAVINAYLVRNMDRTSGQPGPYKPRGVDDVTDALLPFYYDLGTSFQRYIQSVIPDIEMAKFFGKDLVQLEKGGHVYTNTSASIGKLIGHELDAKRMTHQQALELDKLLHLWAHNRTATAPAIQVIRNLVYAGLLPNPSSALVQITDIPMVAFKAGIGPTARTVLRGLVGKWDIDIEKMGIANRILPDLIGEHELPPARSAGEHMAQQAALYTAKFLSVSMLGAGFAAMDRFSKGVATNAPIRRLQNLAQTPKGVEEIARKYGLALGDQFPALIDDLKARRTSESVVALAFSELSDLQPISRLEKARGSLELRGSPLKDTFGLVYVLKNWMLRQADIGRRDVYNELRAGHYPRGLTNLFKYALALYAMGVSGTVVRDWALGRDVSVEIENATENIVKTFGWSNYVLDKVKQGKFSEAFGVAIAPPYQMFDEILRADPKAVRYIPLIGKQYESREMGGAERYNEAKRKREAREIREEAR